MVLVSLRMMVWLMGVSWLRKVLACSGVVKNTLIDLGASKVVEVRCWMRWMWEMVGSICLSLEVKSKHASPREWGYSVSQKRKRLSGRLRTNMMVLSASPGGGGVSACVQQVWQRIEDG